MVVEERGYPMRFAQGSRIVCLKLSSRSLFVRQNDGFLATFREFVAEVTEKTGGDLEIVTHPPDCSMSMQ